MVTYILQFNSHSLVGIGVVSTKDRSLVTRIPGREKAMFQLSHSCPIRGTADTREKERTDTFLGLRSLRGTVTKAPLSTMRFLHRHSLKDFPGDGFAPISVHSAPALMSEMEFGEGVEHKREQTAGHPQNSGHTKLAHEEYMWTES